MIFVVTSILLQPDIETEDTMDTYGIVYLPTYLGTYSR